MQKDCSYPLLTTTTYSFHIISNILHCANVSKVYILHCANISKASYISSISMYKLLRAHIHTFTFHLPWLSIQWIWAVYWIISLCVLSISLRSQNISQHISLLLSIIVMPPCSYLCHCHQPVTSMPHYHIKEVIWLLGVRVCFNNTSLFILTEHIGYITDWAHCIIDWAYGVSSS